MNVVHVGVVAVHVLWCVTVHLLLCTAPSLPRRLGVAVIVVPGVSAPGVRWCGGARGVRWWFQDVVVRCSGVMHVVVCRRVVCRRVV